MLVQCILPLQRALVSRQKKSSRTLFSSWPLGNSKLLSKPLFFPIRKSLVKYFIERNQKRKRERERERERERREEKLRLGWLGGHGTGKRCHLCRPPVRFFGRNAVLCLGVFFFFELSACFHSTLFHWVLLTEQRNFLTCRVKVFSRLWKPWFLLRTN